MTLILIHVIQLITIFSGNFHFTFNSNEAGNTRACGRRRRVGEGGVARPETEELSSSVGVRLVT